MEEKNFGEKFRNGETKLQGTRKKLTAAEKGEVVIWVVESFLKLLLLGLQ